MPRAAPDQVHVHRIELGTWERTHLEDMQRTDDTEEALKLGIEAAKVLALPVAIAAGGYLAYLGLVEMSTGRDRLSEWWQANKPEEGDGAGPFRGGPSLFVDGLLDFAGLVNRFMRTGSL